MDLHIESSLYARFCKLKDDYGKTSLSDNEFFAAVISHLESCCLDNPSHNPKCGSFSNSKITVDWSKLSCPECKFLPSSSDNLWNHFETAHAEEGCFSCTCGDSYTRMPTFLKHYVECPVAATDLQDPVDGEAPPKRLKLSPNHVTNRVDNCDDSLDNSDSPSEVFHSYHHPSVSPVAGPSDDKPYGCPKCYKGFKSKSLLDQHMHLHFPPRYKCRWCGNVYRWPPVYYHHKQKCKKRPNRDESDSHELSEYSNGPEDSLLKFSDTCVSNEQVAMAQRTLAQFMNLHGMPFHHSSDTSETSLNNTPNGTESSCQLTCLCAEVFPTLNLYMDHMKVCPSFLSASSVFENFKPQTLGYPPNLGLDLSTPTNVLKPEDTTTSIAEDLSSYKEQHISQSPGVNGIFSCSICGKEFNSKLSLKQHVDGKHRPEGKYLCPTCGKRYRWGASFYYHKKTCIASEPNEVIVSPKSGLLTSRT